MVNYTIMDWFDKRQIFEPDAVGTTLFLTAAEFMTRGDEEGALHRDDILFWVQGVQKSNSYGEAEETCKTIREFEELVLVELS